MSPRQIHETLERVRWAADDVRSARECRHKRTRRGFLRSALGQLEAAARNLEALEREAWEES